MSVFSSVFLSRVAEVNFMCKLRRCFFDFHLFSVPVLNYNFITRTYLAHMAASLHIRSRIGYVIPTNTILLLIITCKFAGKI